MEDRLVSRDFEQFSNQLASRGWSVLPNESIDADPAVTLRRLGKIVPQYNGCETFEVTYRPGYDQAPYSQSMNALGAHTEAPGFTPPPKYLALYCHRQARCGKGQTLIADGVHFYDKVLSKELREWSSANEVEFVATAAPGEGARKTFRAPIRVSYEGEPLLRFSYNLFRYGNVNPDATDVRVVETQPADPLGKIAEEGEAFFADNLIPVLIPDGCMLVWNNHRLIHGRGNYSDQARHLTRYWLA
jgi:hypothetical protein